MVTLNRKNKNIIVFLLIVIILSVFTGEIISIIKNRDTKTFTESVQLDSAVMMNITSCLSLTDVEYQKCLDNFIEKYFLSTGKTTKQVLADLDKARSNSVIEASCHPISHTIGRIAYKLIKNVGDAFESCDQTCSSGCYHGVMERVFFSESELSEGLQHLTYKDFESKIPGICDKDKFSDPNPFLIFSCLHGVGHAVMYSLNYNLDESLKVCDIFQTDYDRSSCYGGVIMENITGFDKKKRDLKADDPLYPCNRLADKFLPDCYTMQTSVMLEQGLTSEQIITECRKAGKFASFCFLSMGRDLSNYARAGDSNYVAKQCESAGDNWSDCIRGAIYSLIDFSWDLNGSSVLCNSLSTESHVRTCYENQVSYFRTSYAKQKDEIDNNCRSFAGRNQDLCLSLNINN